LEVSPVSWDYNQMQSKNPILSFWIFLLEGWLWVNLL
jgi:hypothetical protein